MSRHEARRQVCSGAACARRVRGLFEPEPALQFDGEKSSMLLCKEQLSSMLRMAIEIDDLRVRVDVARGVRVHVARV